MDITQRPLRLQPCNRQPLVEIVAEVIHFAICIPCTNKSQHSRTISWEISTLFWSLGLIFLKCYALLWQRSGKITIVVSMPLARKRGSMFTHIVLPNAQDIQCNWWFFWLGLVLIDASTQKMTTATLGFIMYVCKNCSNVGPENFVFLTRNLL